MQTVERPPVSVAIMKNHIEKLIQLMLIFPFAI